MIKAERDDYRGQISGRLNRASHVFLLGSGLLIAIIFYWAMLRAPSLLANDDNPRLVEAERKLRRGSIVDTNGKDLIKSIGPIDDIERLYSKDSMSPAFGYYSLRHGTAGLELGLDGILRGERPDDWRYYWEHEILHMAKVGRNVRVTVDSRLQRGANEILGDLAGTALLLTLPDLAIRAIASQPSYDPNTLDEAFESLIVEEGAPLLNRATQGLYQPGMVIQPFLMAAAIDSGLITIDGHGNNAKMRVLVNGAQIICENEPQEPSSWARILKDRCPGPMATLGNLLGSSEILQIYRQFGFDRSPELPMPSAVADDFVINDVSMAAVGQDSLTLTPLHIALATAALMNGGIYQQALIVDAVQDEKGQWIPFAPPDIGTRVISEETARQIIRSFPSTSGIGEHATTAIAGPSGDRNAWYVGFAPSTDPRFLVVLLFEGEGSTLQITQAGRSLLRAAIEG